MVDYEVIFLAIRALEKNDHCICLESSILDVMDAIFSMPMYVGGSLETGNAWQGRGNVAFGDMPVSGSLFFGFSSPLGPLFFGYGRSSAGSDSWYLSFGSLLRQDPR